MPCCGVRLRVLFGVPYLSGLWDLGLGGSDPGAGLLWSVLRSRAECWGLLPVPASVIVVFLGYPEALINTWSCHIACASMKSVSEHLWFWKGWTKSGLDSCWGAGKDDGAVAQSVLADGNSL